MVLNTLDILWSVHTEHMRLQLRLRLNECLDFYDAIHITWRQTSKESIAGAIAGEWTIGQFFIRWITFHFEESKRAAKGEKQKIGP